jgi:hypothetical protein
MADELDDFLKQAAQRRQQRQQQRSNRPPVVQPEPQPVRQAPTPRLQQQDPVPVAPVVEYQKPYEPTVGNLSTSLPSATRESDVEQADDRMRAHVQQVFQHELSSLRQSETKTKKKQKKEQQLKETPATVTESQPTAKVSSASLAAQLRDPQSLRMAIIAHEIMKRPWQ